MLGPKLTPLALMVLELLTERELHPYEMRQLLLERRRDRHVKITPGSLYRTVERLAEDGLIEVVETSRAGRRPERTVYMVTEAGSDGYAEQLREMLAIPADEYPQFPAVLACVHYLSKEDALTGLNQRRMQLEAGVAAYDAVIERLGKGEAPPVFWIDVQYRQAMQLAELRWVEQTIDDLTWDRLDWPAGEER
ncbi:PadR family transcriptional regulator [Actinocrispum wychmicini]|uniref:PadR family transcriptional regulator n=1 Tax=Actinocrispum wychmicini TaxID=1213861 RepID=A0A4R2KGN9_9PSEU|nr:PadR family transcriptional regulator [Actinocrispum wychmicini]TCO65605.1 PadR family transcriptional regulator [Actinocrispum wychmicini]